MVPCAALGNVWVEVVALLALQYDQSLLEYWALSSLLAVSHSVPFAALFPPNSRVSSLSGAKPLLQVLSALEAMLPNLAVVCAPHVRLPHRAGDEQTYLLLGASSAGMKSHRLYCLYFLQRIGKAAHRDLSQSRLFERGNCPA